LFTEYAGGPEMKANRSAHEPSVSKVRLGWPLNQRAGRHTVVTPLV
jgi:hypothetical protein